MGAKGNNTHQFHTRKVKGYVTLKKVRKTLNMVPWGRRVTMYLVERDMPSLSHEGTGEEYRWQQTTQSDTHKQTSGFSLGVTLTSQYLWVTSSTSS